MVVKAESSRENQSQLRNWNFKSGTTDALFPPFAWKPAFPAIAFQTLLIALKVNPDPSVFSFASSVEASLVFSRRLLMVSHYYANRDHLRLLNNGKA